MGCRRRDVGSVFWRLMRIRPKWDTAATFLDQPETSLSTINPKKDPAAPS